MSTQTYPQQESAYDLLPTEELTVDKLRYVSKFRPSVLLEEEHRRRRMRTMGAAKVELPSPQEYLKKHSKEPQLSEKPQSAKEGRIHPLLKPPVPTRAEIPQTTLSKHDKDLPKTFTFTTTKPKPISVDGHKGHKEALENSGLVPKYVHKKDFGKVPVYLVRHNAEKQKAQEEYDSYVKEQKEAQALKQLSEEERLHVLEGLKLSWSRLHLQYQGLPLVIETISMKALKERLENDMKRLEKDIDKFDRFKIIYIADN